MPTFPPQCFENFFARPDAACAQRSRRRFIPGAGEVRPPGRRRSAVVAAVVLLGVAAPVAHGREYEIWSCRTPDGTIAPIGDSAAGWQLNLLGTTGAGGQETDTSCAGDGAFGAALLGAYPHGPGEGVLWSFVAPADTSIWGFEAVLSGSGRAGYYLNDGDLFVARSDQADPNYVARWYGSFAFGDTPVGQWGIDIARYAIGVRCSGGNWCTAGSEDLARVRVSRTVTVLADADVPVVGGVSGGLVDGGTLQGTESVTFHATDRGSGVYRLLLDVDEVPRVARVIDGNGGRCAELGGGSRPRYANVRPCPLSAGGDIAVDTRTLPEGEHGIRLRVADAAGNATTIYQARRTIDNIPPPRATAPPEVYGDARVGQLLFGQDGTWTGENVTLTRRWLRCQATANTNCTVIAGTDGRTTYRLQPDDAGSVMRLEVEARNAQGATVERSAPTDQVRLADGSGPGGGSAKPASAGAVAGETTTSPGRPNGDNASRQARITAAFVRNHKPTLTVRRGARLVIKGRLVDGGTARGIANARVEAVHELAAGLGRLDKGGVRTRADGRFTYILPRNLTSRAIVLGYRAFEGDPVYAAQRTLTLRVRATSLLYVAPRSARNGQRVTFAGRVVRPAPARGVQVLLQARVDGGWRTFRTARTNRRGSWSTSYRFTKIRRATRLRVRAKVLRDSGYAFESGASRSRTLVVR